MTGVAEVLSFVLREPVDPAEMPELPAWWRAHLVATEPFARPVDRAIAGGFVADRAGFAFASGYQEAGRAMFGALDRRTLAAFCVTERGSTKPRAMKTTLERHADGTASLRGEKTFVTLGDAATALFVVAREIGAGTDERPVLRVARVDPKRAGVVLTPLPTAPFVPEVPHAMVTLDGALVAPGEIEDGDGYDRFVKPFRTIEDLHVHAAITGYLVRLARRASMPDAVLEEACAHLVTLRALAAAPPDAPEGHVALAGALAGGARWLAALDPMWPALDDATRAGWQRDKVLLTVAGKARALRRDRAWERLRG